MYIVGRAFLVVLILLALLVPLAGAAPAQADRGPWAPNVWYNVGDTVTYTSVTYQAIQAHTSQTGWEPPNVPALWGKVSGPTNTPTRTPTKTNTPSGPTNTPTRTPTKTNTPVGPTNTPTRTPTSSGGNCWPAWNTSTVYNGGAQVSRNSQNYQAAYWTQGQDPATNSGPAGSGQPWIPMGSCNGGATSTPTRTPTKTNTPTIGPSLTPSRTPTPTATSGSNTGLPKRVMVGYWHNFDNGSGFIRLRDVSPKWDVINVSFAEPTSPTSGNMVFTPYNYTQTDFRNDVVYLRGLGKKVVISIGGANGQVQLTTTTARDNFVNSMIAIIDTYGFDGMDIDFEGHSLILNPGDTDFTNPTTPVIVNTISAIRSIRNRYGSNFILTMAPETFFVQLGYSFYGGTCSGCDTRAGAYLPVIYATRDILTWLQVQDYNSGPITALDGRYYSMGNADFHAAMLEMLLAGFPVAGTGKTFPALRQDQVVLGVPATVNAGNGYLAPAEVQKALNYIIKGQSYGGGYVLHNPSGYPNLRGVMTWSINWDAFAGFEFSNSYRTYLNSLP